MLGKQEKMGKVVGRVKLLLEKEEGAGGGKGRAGAAANSKSDVAKVGEVDLFKKDCCMRFLKIYSRKSIIFAFVFTPFQAVHRFFVC